MSEFNAQTIVRGGLGFFVKPTTWPPNIAGEVERGWIQIGDGEVRLDVLEEDPSSGWPADPLPIPKSVVGVLSAGAVMMLEISPRIPTIRMGNYCVSTARYHARSILGNLDLDHVKSDRLRSLSASFALSSRWDGLPRLQEEWVQDEVGRAVSWTGRTPNASEYSANLTDDRRLTVLADWSVDGSHQERRVSQLTRFTVESSSPQELWDLMEPLLIVQDLINVAHGGFVAAETGRAVADLDNLDEQRVPTWFWSAPLHYLAPQLPKVDMQRTYPLFTLADIGGIDGLARWVYLRQQHPRGLSPITRPLRQGPLSPEVGILEAAAAIEYWAKAHKLVEETSEPRYVQALIEQVREPFIEFCGDPEIWTNRFWQSNNAIKHASELAHGDDELTLLARSARYLLTAVALAHVAQSQTPVKALLKSPNLQSLSNALRSMTLGVASS